MPGRKQNSNKNHAAATEWTRRKREGATAGQKLRQKVWRVNSLISRDAAGTFTEKNIKELSTLKIGTDGESLP